MNLPQQLLEHKTMMVAILLLARRIAQALEIDPALGVADACRIVGANRTSVYEQLGRILEALGELAAARPGRPGAQAPPQHCHHDALAQLTIEVLEYRVNYPGSVVEYRHRTEYADAFRRFILERRDRCSDTLRSFAQAVRVPLDTLRDWIGEDRRQGLKPQEQKKRPPLTVNASQLTREIVDEWTRWRGPARAFIGYAHERFELSTALISRLMKILGLIGAQSRKPPRFRGSTLPLSPGTTLVTDGKWIPVRLMGLETTQTVYFNWQGIVDQTTACDTAAVISEQEDAAAVREAYDRSLRFLAGAVPDALLHDNKPCYDEAQLRQALRDHGTDMIHATPRRPQNKAVLEGAFALWDRRVGSICLDDSDDESLIRTAVREAVRAYTAATNAVPRIEFDGRSRLAVLQQHCPTEDQRQRDQQFLAQLKADHRRGRSRPPQPLPESLALIDYVFERNDLLEHDPKGDLRRYLATFNAAAIRRAAAILAAKIQRNQIQYRYAHRYLAKVIRTQQQELDLQRVADELYELTRRQNQNWTQSEEQEFYNLASDQPLVQDLATKVAERAAFGGIPLQATFWNRKLLELLQDQAAELVETVKTHLIRLYEAPVQHRIELLDLITAQQQELI